MTKLTSDHEIYAFVRKQALKSHCQDRKVGCVIIGEDGEVYGYGHNRTECRKKCAKFDGQACPAHHAEMEAVSYLEQEKLARQLADPNFQLPDSLIAYVSYQPCQWCVKTLEEVGVKCIVYFEMSDVDLPEFSGEYKYDPHPPKEPFYMMLANIRDYHMTLGYPNTLCDKETQFDQAREILLAMQQEVSEVTDSIQWKPWRKARNYCRYNMLEELGDVIFFIDSLLMNFGCTWGDLNKVMEDKLEECHNRIKRGYHK